MPSPSKIELNSNHVKSLCNYSVSHRLPNCCTKRDSSASKCDIMAERDIARLVFQMDFGGVCFIFTEHMTGEMYISLDHICRMIMPNIQLGYYLVPYQSYQRLHYMKYGHESIVYAFTITKVITVFHKCKNQYCVIGRNMSLTPCHCLVLFLNMASGSMVIYMANIRSSSSTALIFHRYPWLINQLISIVNKFSHGILYANLSTANQFSCVMFTHSYMRSVISNVM